jgi:6-phosphogluconolactonase
MNQRVEVFPDHESFFRAAAELIVNEAHAAITRSGRFAFVLTGGSTPKGLYELLASDEWRDKIDWSKVHFFWGDERFVPASDKQSNFGMAKTALLDHLPVPAANIHRIVTENTTPEICAANYEADIRRFFGTVGKPFPSFDLMLNGLGSNRHTASLFPHRPTLHERERLVVADFIPEVSMNRITMTAPLHNAAHKVVFLVAGKDKAEAVNDVINGARDIETKPAQLIHPENGELVWMLDSEAASLLPNREPK